MKEFNRALAMSGVCFSTALGTLGIGEYANERYTDNTRACYKDFDGEEAQACKEGLGPDPDNSYGLIVLGLGAAGIFMGSRAYKAHEAQVKRDEEYRQAEDLV